MREFDPVGHLVKQARSEELTSVARDLITDILACSKGRNWLIARDKAFLDTLVPCLLPGARPDYEVTWKQAKWLLSLHAKVVTVLSLKDRPDPRETRARARSAINASSMEEVEDV